MFNSKRSSLVAVVAMLALLCSAVAFADSDSNQISVAADSSSGTYAKMLGEIVGVCNSDRLDITQAKNGGGAPGNLDALVNNKAQAAFLHSDVYYVNAMSDSSYAKFQTLVSLYPEPIHVLALADSKSSKHGTLAFGKQTFTSLSDFAGYKVGAAGGGVYTARVLTGQGHGNFEVVAFNSGGEVIKALQNGDIDAAIFVGAAPLPNLEQLPRGVFKLLPIGDSIAQNVQGVYRQATINYTNGLTSGPLKTMAPLSVLLTRKYSTPQKVAAQREFRACFYRHLDELKDNGAPNWQQVDANDHGTLPWYEIPDGQTTEKASRSK